MLVGLTAQTDSILQTVPSVGAACAGLVLPRTDLAAELQQGCSWSNQARSCRQFYLQQAIQLFSDLPAV